VPGTLRERNRRGEGQRLRTEIVTAAERLLSSQPVEALSLRAVAREAGVSAPALYLHFTDRRELVWAVLEHQFDELAQLTSNAATSSATTTEPRAQLREWCLTYCRFGLNNPGRYRALFESWTAQHVDLPLAQLPGHQLWQDLQALVAACGTATVETEVEELSTLIWAQLHGLVSLRINKPSFPWSCIEELVDGYLRRMLSGGGGRPPTARVRHARS
jgi:AcrR family transcriptional regulator